LKVKDLMIENVVTTNEETTKIFVWWFAKIEG